MLAPSASWIPIPDNSDFTLQNLPFGVCSTASNIQQQQGSHHRACATIVGDTVIHLGVLEEAGLFADIMDWTPQTFQQPTLNKFMEHSPSVWSAVRKRLLQLLMMPETEEQPQQQSTHTTPDNDDDQKQNSSTLHPDPRLFQNTALQTAALHPMDTVTLHLPMTISEYTDFYSSREHATNVGIMFRGKEQALQPNWLHLPVGYHGRASTVHVSGHAFPRPCGQIQNSNSVVHHGPTQLLDFELEMGTIVGGRPRDDHRPLTIAQARRRIFGFVLLNDWSARDIQKFEYVPLGPFTSKHFATTISPWIVTAEALQPWKCPTSAGVQDNPTPLPYLQDDDYSSYNIDLTVAIQTPKQSSPQIVGRSNFRNLYWNAVQQLVHHSVTGCTMRAGDLLGSGTISGSEPGSYGSMLELSWKGTKPIAVGEEETRTFLQDGDTVIMKGIGQAIGDKGTRIGFGECRGTILPAVEAAKIMEEEAPKESEQYNQVKLYGYHLSSSTIRVKIALAAKKIDYELVEINLRDNEHKTPEYLDKNPLGQVPMLECTDSENGQVVRIAQSMAIIDFLEEGFPRRQSLFPREALSRTRARQMVEIVNSGTQPLQNKFYLAGLEESSNGTVRAIDEGRKACERGLPALERLVAEHQSGSGKGPFCMGTFSPTIADIYMVPQLANARDVFNVDVKTICPTLVETDAQCAKHEWFIKAKEKQP